MKQYSSPTSNGGKTIILDSVQDAITTANTWLEDTIKRYESSDEKLTVVTKKRDGGTSKGKTMSSATLAEKWKGARPRLAACSEAIVKGDDALKASIHETLELLRDMALEIEPMLAVGYRGYERSEDGFTAAAELVAAGEENPCFQRKKGSDSITKRPGDGAYRVLINTDVSWMGRPDDNAAVMGALITLLQQFGPVEVWIQQGWMRQGDGDGVTLFKLDFTGSFEATQLAFWLGHPDKDAVFSNLVNRGLGREGTGTSIHAELSCDLYLRGDWMVLAGITAEKLAQMMHTERIDLMAKWVATTAIQIIHPENPNNIIEA